MTTKRIRLSRAKGYRLPRNAVNVARPSHWGNPFVVGKDGTREECVSLYALMLGGCLALSTGPSIAEQQAASAHVWANIDSLKGLDLACWCALDGKPCHADVLMVLANEKARKGCLDRFILSPLVGAGR